MLPQLLPGREVEVAVEDVVGELKGTGTAAKAPVAKMASTEASV